MAGRVSAFAFILTGVILLGCSSNDAIPTQESPVRSRQAVSLSDAGAVSTSTGSVNTVTDAGVSATELARIQAYLDSGYTAKDIWRTFETKLGQTIDCIDWFAQPGVKAMAAKGTPITEIPTSPPLPAGVAQDVIPMPDWGFNGAPDKNGVPRECPPKSTPMVRVTIADILAAGGLDAYLHAQTSRPIPDDIEHTDNYAHDRVRFDHGGPGAQIYYGTGTLSITPPTMPNEAGGTTNFMFLTFGDHSLSQLWMVSGTGYNLNGQNCPAGQCNDPGHTDCASTACLQTIEAGWMMEPGNTYPYYFNFTTHNGYADRCWGVSKPNHTKCDDNTTDIPFIQTPQAWPVWQTNLGFSSPGDGTHQELPGLSIYNPDGNWHIYCNGHDNGYYPSSFYTGAMKHTAEDFEVGGEVYDQSGTWIVPMGSGASATAGYGQSAYVSNSYACYVNNGAFCLRDMSPTDTINGGLGQRGVYDHATSGNYWFYYGTAPHVFWGQNYGFQWAPPGNYPPYGQDWAYGWYKGECGYALNPGQGGSPLTGISAYTNAPYAHAVQCNSPFVVTTPQSGIPGPQNGNPGTCYPIDSDNRWCNSNLGDWDPGYLPGECDCGDYVSGISQNYGAINKILCCPGEYVSGSAWVSLSQSNCNVQNLGSVGSNSADWDPNYYKAQCSVGQYVAAVSSGRSQPYSMGPPHSILCCHW